MVGGFPCGEDLGVSLVNAADDGVEGLDGGSASADGVRDAGGGADALTEGGALLAFAAFEGGGHLFEMGGGVCGVSVGLELVIERKLADGGGEGTRLGDEAAIAISVWHAEPLHERGIPGFCGNGIGGGVDVLQFVFEFLAELALFFSLLTEAAAGLDGLFPTKDIDGRDETSAGGGEFRVDLSRRLVGEIGEEGSGKFAGAEKCLGLVLLAAVHGVQPCGEIFAAR